MNVVNKKFTDNTPILRINQMRELLQVCATNTETELILNRFYFDNTHISINFSYKKIMYVLSVDYTDDNSKFNIRYIDKSQHGYPVHKGTMDIVDVFEGNFKACCHKSKDL